MKMLKINFTKIAYLSMFAGLLMILNSCSSTSSVSMQVLISAQINVPLNVKKVAIANRSLPSKQNEFINIMEGFITGESIHADRDASNNCVRSIVDKLNSAPRFNAVLVNYPQLYGTGTSEWPAPLNWITIDSICSMYNSDALIVLETYDSDILFKTGSNLVKQNVNGRDTMMTEFFSDLKINVNAGWRIYDNVDKKIIDQNPYMDEKDWLTKGPILKEALKKLPNKRDAINGAGVYAGEQYGFRISPTWVNVYRSYFIRCKKENGFKEAKKYIAFNNWDKAVATWTNLAKYSDPKIAGRAYYNLALASEMNGDLDKAYTYAKKAYHDYFIPAAGSYMNILNARINDQSKLKEQMGK